MWSEMPKTTADPLHQQRAANQAWVVLNLSETEPERQRRQVSIPKSCQGPRDQPASIHGDEAWRDPSHGIPSLEAQSNPKKQARGPRVPLTLLFADRGCKPWELQTSNLPDW